MTPGTASTWTPIILLREILDLRWDQYKKHSYGPFVLYLSKEWEDYLPHMWLPRTMATWNKTIKDRILDVDGIDLIVFNERLPAWDAELRS